MFTIHKGKPFAWGKAVELMPLGWLQGCCSLDTKDQEVAAQKNQLRHHGYGSRCKEMWIGDQLEILWCNHTFIPCIHFFYVRILPFFWWISSMNWQRNHCSGGAEDLQPKWGGRPVRIHLHVALIICKHMFITGLLFLVVAQGLALKSIPTNCTTDHYFDMLLTGLPKETGCITTFKFRDITLPFQATSPFDQALKDLIFYLC